MTQPDRSHRTHDGGARNSQELLAASLVATLGLDAAIHVCHANTWHGVLTYVISAVTSGQGAGEATAG